MKIKDCFLIYFLYLFVAWFIGLFFFLSNCNLPITIVCLVLILIVAFFVAKNKSLVNSFQLIRTNVHWIDAFFIAVIFLLSIKIAIPDNSFDALNYHIFSIENPFENNVSNNVFPCGLQSFIGGYSDVLFYLPHMLWGYRVGTIVNTLILLLIYFQIRDILLLITQKANPESLSSFRKSLISFFSFLVISTEGILCNLCIYKNDLLFIPILLELLSIILFSERRNYTYIFILSSFAVLIKFTSIIFVLPILVAVYFSDLKKEKISFVLGKAFAIFFIVLSYEYLFKYQQTGSPLFPFYNKIFKSDYYPIVNFFDERWGPNSFKDILIWPVKIFVSQDRFCEIHYYSGRISLIYLFLPLVFLQWIKRKNRTNLLLWATLIVCLFLWIITSGYFRYGLFLEILSGIFFFFIILDNKINKVLRILFFFLIFLQTTFAYNYFVVKNMDWSWREPFYKNQKLYIDNCKMLFRDNQLTINKVCGNYNGNKAWITIHNSGYCSMLDNSKPICDLSFFNSQKSDRRFEAYQNFFNNYSLKDLSMPVNVNSFQGLISRLNENEIQKFHISSIETIYPSFMKKNEPLFILKFDEAKTCNEVININGGQDKYELAISNDSSDTIAVEAIIGYNPIAYNWNADGFEIVISLQENDKQTLLFKKFIDSNSKFSKIKFEQPIDSLVKKANLQFRIENNDGKNWNGDWITIINPKCYFR